MSSNETSQSKVINVLWSSRAFGGAEVYVETMRTTWGTETSALQSLSAKERLKLAADIAFGSNTYIFHDLRAAFFGFLRPTRRNITVIHGPGKRAGLTRAVIAAQAFIQKRVILVAADIYPAPPTNRVQVLENFSTAGIEATDDSADAIYFGRITASKCVDRLTAFWAEHAPQGQLHVIGDGDLLPELRQRHAQDEAIRFHGALPHREIAAIASDCRYYFSFSDREGLSLSLLEAMDGGLIPLVTAIPSQTFVQEIPGIPTVHDDHAGLAADIAAINALPGAERTVLRNAVRTLVRQRFRDRWMATWSTLLGRVARRQH